MVLANFKHSKIMLYRHPSIHSQGPLGAGLFGFPEIISFTAFERKMVENNCENTTDIKRDITDLPNNENATSDNFILRYYFDCKDFKLD